MTRWLECFAQWDTQHQLLFSIIVVIAGMVVMVLVGVWTLMLLRAMADVMRRDRTPELSVREITKLDRPDVQARADARADARARKLAQPERHEANGDDRHAG